MKTKIYESQLLGATLDITNNRVYFWGGIFSQWVKCNIVDHELGVTLNSTEQGMMLYKAKHFNDDEAYNTILKLKDPRKQKAVGRQVKNFDEKSWSDVSYDIVTKLNYLKFSQNAAWKELLILTGDSEIVEASPYDKIWGVGLSENDEQIYDKGNWDGENLLGKAIMEARDLILDDLVK